MPSVAQPVLRNRRFLALAAATTFVFGAAACSGDDDASTTTDAAVSTTPTTTPTTATDAVAADLAAYCAAEVALDEAFQQLDPSDPEAFQAALAEVGPIIERIVAEPIDAVADEFAVLKAAYEQVVAAGDPSPFFAEEVAVADATVHAYDLENCGWEVVDITAADYHFIGSFPTTAGAVSFEVNNAGNESHVLLVARKKDSVADSALDAFSTVESEEDLLKVFDMAASVYAEPGGSDFAITELTPGEYVAFCPVLGGTTPDAEGAGPPHFVQGMVTAFEVA